MAFNLLDYLSSRNIAYKTEGKNVGREDVAISCLFCDDPSYHLNIHRIIGMWRCFICGEKGGIFNLVKAIEPEGTRIKDVLADYFDYEIREKEEERKQFKIDFSNIEEAGEAVDNIFYPLLLEWLEERGFDFLDISNWFARLSKSYDNYFAYRLVIPIYESNKIVCFVGRDLTGRANIRYLPVPNGSTIKSYQSCLYNTDEAAGKNGLMLVEGIFDVWRLKKFKDLNNYTIVATNGKVLSYEQRELIKKLVNRKDLMEVVICLDGGSRKEIKEFVSLVSPYHRNITVVDLPGGEDPDSLGLKGQFEYYFYRRQRIS